MSHPLVETPKDWTPPERYADAKPRETMSIPLYVGGPFHLVTVLEMPDGSVRVVDFVTKEDVCHD